VVKFNEPRVGAVRVHENDVPAGQVPPVQTTVVEKVAVPPIEIVSVDGLTVTDERPGSMVMVVAELITVFPFKVALTNSASVPVVVPA
jgi:hypothetical protein